MGEQGENVSGPSTFKPHENVVFSRPLSSTTFSAGRLEPPFRDVIKRHVAHVNAHNQFLEKRQMWQQFETEETERLARKHERSSGMFKREQSGEETHFCMQKDGRKSVSVTSRGSFDVHAAERLMSARDKEKARLQQIVTGAGDSWRPDKFYTHELQMAQPWVDPREMLLRSLTTKQSDQNDLTPRASSSSERSTEGIERATRLKSKKKKKRKSRKKDKRWRKKKKKKSV